MKLIALIDCNNFFASCERLMNPALKERPVVVLSSNDGCIIARSNEVKAMGVAMGVPLFQVKEILEKNKAVICSANFSLYSEISSRVMSALAEIVEELEVYSIDEAFFSFGDSTKVSSKALYEQAQYVQTYIEKNIGIPVSIGIATTKTLAKLANKSAKDRKLGIFSLHSDNPDLEQTTTELDLYLKTIPVADVWGIGKASQRLLEKNCIYSAYDLKCANDMWIKQHMNINGMRTVLELRSRSCFPLDSERHNEPSQSIINSRSFGEKIKTLEEVKEAVANFVSTATRRLRAQNLIASELQVYLQIHDGFGSRGRQLDASIQLESPSAETPKFIEAANEIIDEIFIPGLLYRKAGVMLTGLKAANTLQLNLFHSEPESHVEQSDISKIVDKINKKLGANSVFWAAMGNPSQKQAWQAKREWTDNSISPKKSSKNQVPLSNKTRFYPVL